MLRRCAPVSEASELLSLMLSSSSTLRKSTPLSLFLCHSTCSLRFVGGEAVSTPLTSNTPTNTTAASSQTQSSSSSSSSHSSMTSTPASQVSTSSSITNNSGNNNSQMMSRGVMTNSQSRFVTKTAQPIQNKQQPFNTSTSSTSPASTSVRPTLNDHKPFPARQNPFLPDLNKEDAKVLLSKAQYSIFTIAYDEASSTCAIYCATSNELLLTTEKLLWKAAMWVDEHVGEEYIAALLFACHNAPTIKSAMDVIVNKAQKRTIVAPDAWGITYSAFRAQQEVVRGVELPTSPEHAAFLLSSKQFDPSLVEPTIFDHEKGAYVSGIAPLNVAGTARDAVLAWSVLFNVHRRFGTPGSRKTLSPVEQIVRRVVKAVNIFVVDINVRVGKGTISEGHTMIVTIYDAQRRTQSTHTIRSLAEETGKLNALTTLLYGEGSSSISLFVPTARTKAAQLVAFARTCRPKSPFFVAEIASLAPFFGGQSMSRGVQNESDPRSTWGIIRNNCYTEKHLRKDDEKLDRYLQRGFAALANKLFSDRLRKVSPSIMEAVNTVPTPQESSSEFTKVIELIEELKSNPVAPITTTTFLNRVDVSDAEVVFGLQQWRAKIYDNAKRYEREKKAAEQLRRYLIVDLETTTIRRYKRIANPFTKENFVVLSGARDYNGNVFMPKRYFDRSIALRYDDTTVTSVNNLVEHSSPDSLFFPPLDDYDVLVGHNIKFDLLHTWRDVELRKFLRRGGKIWDTMYAEYLLSGQEVKLGCGAGLEDIAKSYGGQTPKLDAVKRAWAEGKETYEIPYALLTEYLHGDLENTELIFRKQWERALQQRQMIICSARMDGVLCTTEMEYNGLKTNVELAQSQSTELMTKVTELRNKLEAVIPGELPPDCRKFFNWSSNQHLISFFFGSKLKLSTHSRESRNLPGEEFARHTLFISPEAYSRELYPNGVFLCPPIHVLGICDCAIMAGVSTEKGTRVFKAYYDVYMKQASFRKSSTLSDSLKREMTAIPRSNPDKHGTVSALANLLPRRHLFLFASIALTSTEEIAKLFVKNPITGESITITSEAKGPELRAFISSQVKAHTEMIVPVDEESSADNNAFVEAQVTIFALDAAFSFRKYINTDATLKSYLDKHGQYNNTITTSESNNNSSLSKGEIAERYSIALADTVSTLTYYKNVYGAEDEELRSASSSSLTAKSKAKSKKKTNSAATSSSSSSSSLLSTTTKDRVVGIVPPKALPRPCRKKCENTEAYRRKLLQEANMKPEEWCNYYIDIFLHIANAALQFDGLQAPAKPRRKAQGSSSSSSSSSKSSSKSSTPKSASDSTNSSTTSNTASLSSISSTMDDELPVLMRQRRAFVGYYNSLPEPERKRLSLMCLTGRTVSTPYDCFAVPCAHDDVVDVQIKGRLAMYIPNELEAEHVMRRFRSPISRQLQVGEDTLHYFTTTHHDEAAQTILELRALEKLIGTYYESTDGGSGMVSLVHPNDSCIHHELIHNKTNTGRLASANPNCQNIPTEDKSRLRDMFISRYGEKGMCIEADYSQLEVVALAVLASDEQMLDDLRHNVDFHCKRVTMMRPDLKYTEVLQRAKRNKEPEFVKLRQQAKIFSFQRQYGAGAKMISKSTGLTQDQVRMLIEKERETYRGVDVFNNMVTLSANSYDASLQNGAKNVRGHQFFKGMFPVLTGSRYVFTESDIPENVLNMKYGSRKSTNFSPTHLKNYPVQGFAGEIVQILLGVLWRHFLKVNNYDGLAVLTNTVHDCVWVDCHESVYHQVAKDVERIMTSVRSVLNALYPEMNVSVDFPCDVVAGENMGALRPIIEETVL